MAIRLASAIGQQRKPVDMYGGIDDAINKTGDALQAQQAEKAKAAAKKADQDQAYKDAIVANMNIKPLENVRAEDRAEYENFVKSKMGDLIVASKDRNVSKGQIEQMQRDILEGVNTRHYTYQRDYEYGKKLKEDKDKGYMVEDMENFITGKEKFTPTVPTESISQQGGGYGVPTQEESLGTIEASGTPYFSKTLEERALTPIEDEYSKRVKMPTLGALEALKDIRGKEFSPSDFVTRTVNKKGGHDFAVNKAKVEDEANKYAIHMVGNTNYGKNQNQTKVAMEKQAYLALQQAGLSDSEIAKEMPNVVRQLAYDDFMRKVQPAIDGELTRQKEEPLRKEGKNSEFNINIGAGGENKLWKFGIPAETQLREGATREVDSKKLVKGKEGKLIDYDYISMQTKVPADNPPITVGNNSGMHFQGVYKNRNNGDISYFKFTKAADGSGEEILVPLNELKSSTFTDIKTNIGEDDFDKATATGKYKQNKAAPKKADLKGKKYAGIDANGNPIFK